MNPGLLAAEQAHKTFLAAYGQMCGRKYYIAWRYKFGLDETVKHELWGLLMLGATDIALEEGWTHKKGRIRDFVDLALNELSRPLSGNATAIRAAYIGVSERQWFRLRKHYEAIFRLADDWAQMGYRHIHRMQRT